MAIVCVVCKIRRGYIYRRSRRRSGRAEKTDLSRQTDHAQKHGRNPSNDNHPRLGDDCIQVPVRDKSCPAKKYRNCGA
jgi:hypothetical protein